MGRTNQSSNRGQRVRDTKPVDPSPDAAPDAEDVKEIATRTAEQVREKLHSVSS